MKIEEILKKQGELYTNISKNEAIQESNETIKKPIKLVPYKNYKISKQEYRAIIEVEKLLGIKPEINHVLGLNDFQVSIEDNRIILLRITKQELVEIPEQINSLTNLRTLNLGGNKITEIKNLDNLKELQTLWLYDNQIKEIKGLDNLTSLQELSLYCNQISGIKNLDNLTNLRMLSLPNNQIKEIKGLENLTSLQELWLQNNPIKNKEEARKSLDKIKGVVL